MPNCIVCDSNLAEVLNLGTHAIANNYLNSIDDYEQKFPLILCKCLNKRCELLQLDRVIPANIIFNNDYPWVTGTSPTAYKHAQDFASKLIDELSLKEQSVIFEIASNDGTYLKAFKELNFNILGCDAVERIAEQATINGIKTIYTFWGAPETIRKIRKHIDKRNKPAIILARNVLTHTRNPGPNEFMKFIPLFLKANGTLVIETPYVGTIINEYQYDLIYHEHQTYFSVSSLKFLLNKFNFDITKVQTISGGPSGKGNILVYAKRSNEIRFNKIDKSVFDFIEKENEELIIRSYYSFMNDVEKLKNKLISKLKSLIKDNEIIAAVGAAAKGNTILNYCNEQIEMNTLVKCIFDDNELKQNKFAPGTHIQVLSFDELNKVKPTVLLILAWNFADSLIERLINDYNYEGKFIIANQNIKIKQEFKKRIINYV